METGRIGGTRGGVRIPALAAALLTMLAAPAFFVLELPGLGTALLIAGLALAWAVERRAPLKTASGAQSVGALPEDRRTPSLLRDLSLIAIGLGIVRLIPLAAELDDWAMLRFTLALGGAVAVPYLVSRFVYRDRAIAFPWRGRPEETQRVDAARGAAHGGSPRSEARGGGRPEEAQRVGAARGAASTAAYGAERGVARRGWGVLHWGWLAAVLVLGWLILPWYFIGSGVYTNWPAVDSPELIARLFVGVGAVGIWDELFFICTVFTLLLRHFPAWLANALQAIVFVSFLWELGYRAWGPLLTIPFALVQGFIFLRTHSLSYVVTVHLLFDAVVFAVLVNAHDPSLFDVFVTAP